MSALDESLAAGQRRLAEQLVGGLACATGAAVYDRPFGAIHRVRIGTSWCAHAALLGDLLIWSIGTAPTREVPSGSVVYQRIGAAEA